MTHVEIIKANEKLSPELGGSGYLPPIRPVTLAEVDEAVRAAEKAGTAVAGLFVLKVARHSVNWKKYAQSRRLKFVDGTCDCVVIGSVDDWWFVSVTR